ncbi:MAG: nucleotide exchange factor GrpE [Bacillota bacterium]
MAEDQKDLEAKRPEEGEEELAKAQAAAAENWDRFLRTRAEFENYQKRMQRDLAASIRRGKKDMYLKILGVVDNLDRALDAWGKEAAAGGGPEDPHLAGIEIIRRQLLAALSSDGVVPIEAVGAEFDPVLHDAVAAWEKEDIDRETVTDEIQRGYTYEDEVLRPARVRVAKPAS